MESEQTPIIDRIRKLLALSAIGRAPPKLKPLPPPQRFVGARAGAAAFHCEMSFTPHAVTEKAPISERPVATGRKE